MKNFTRVAFVLALAAAFPQVALAELNENDVASTVGVQNLRSSSIQESSVTSQVTEAAEVPVTPEAKQEADTAFQERAEAVRLAKERAPVGAVETGWNENEAQALSAADAESLAPVVAEESELPEPPAPEEATYEEPREAPRKPKPVLATNENIEALTKADNDFRGYSEKTALYVQGRGGLAVMSAHSSVANVSGRHMLGLGLGYTVNNHLSIEMGYALSEFGVAPRASGGTTNGFSSATTGVDAFTMKQNLVDLGLKFHFRDRDMSIRPFVSGGGAYSRSYVNYDERIQRQYAAQSNYTGTSLSFRDQEVSSFLGYLGTGLDVRMTRSIFLGGSFRYYGILSAQDKQTTDTSFQQSNASASDSTKQAVSASLARLPFYTLFAGLTFVF